MAIWADFSPFSLVGLLSCNLSLYCLNLKSFINYSWVMARLERPKKQNLPKVFYFSCLFLSSLNKLQPWPFGTPKFCFFLWHELTKNDDWGLKILIFLYSFRKFYFFYFLHETKTLLLLRLFPKTITFWNNNKNFLVD